MWERSASVTPKCARRTTAKSRRRGRLLLVRDATHYHGSMLPVVRVGPRGRFRPPRGSTTRRFVRVGLTAFLVAAGGCSKSRKSIPTTPAEPPPPGIHAVFPAPRSTGVFYATDIWAEFDQGLDPATVNERTVFLKLDTQRIPSTITYDAARRRIRVTPLRRLALLRTHTIEITPGVMDVAGGHLSATYFWQFTTNSVRLPIAPAPDSNATRESPFAPLQWEGTEASAGTIVYHLYIADDSAQVATRSVTPIDLHARGYYLARTRWGLDRTLYWTVDTENLTTTEKIPGSLWRFSTMPAGVPVDSLRLAASQWGYIDLVSVVRCGGVLSCGPGYWCAAQWPFETLPPDLKLADGYIAIAPTVVTDITRRPQLWLITDPWPTCTIGSNGPPYTDETDGRLASAGTLPSQAFFFSSDALISHFAGSIRARGFQGYLIRSESLTRLSSPGASQTLVLYYYRDNAPGLTARARRP